MIALTASIRPSRHDVPALRLVEQAFRRNYDSAGIEPHQVIVRLDHWHVLLTMERRRLRTDVVVSTRADGAAFKERFLRELDRWTCPGKLMPRWADSPAVPELLR